MASVRGSKVKLTFKGFDLLLEQINEANGDVTAATEKALKASADMLTQEIRAGAQQRKLGTSTLINPTPVWSGNKCSVEVGYNLGSYDSSNPSEGYKALFKEYGTAKRKTSKGANRGEITANPFIRPAVDNNKSRIKKEQQAALDEILKGLKG